MMPGYRATPDEIGRMRREIREAYRMSKAEGVIPYFLPLKVASLDDRSWIWLIQRMRPAELRMIKAVPPAGALRDGPPEPEPGDAG